MQPSFPPMLFYLSQKCLLKGTLSSHWIALTSVLATQPVVMEFQTGWL